VAENLESSAEAAGKITASRSRRDMFKALFESARGVV
jgi:hypothetical protein